MVLGDFVSAGDFVRGRSSGGVFDWLGPVAGSHGRAALCVVVSACLSLATSFLGGVGLHSIDSSFVQQVMSLCAFRDENRFLYTDSLH
jgi:hypothetical protein